MHIREKGRFNQRYSLLCRDFLRAHPIAASAYALIKQRLAQRFPDDVDF
nr:GrpB family protein [Rhizobium binae]